MSKKRTKIDWEAAFDAAPETQEKDGVLWRKDRVGHTNRDGTFPLSQLRRDEAVVAPGIVYRREPRA